MNITRLQLLLLAASLFSAQPLVAQEPNTKEMLQKRVADVKQSLAANNARLKNYNWTETTLVTIKGDTKKDSQAQCQYGPDGKVQKTPLGYQAPPKEPPGGLRGKIAGKKIAEMQDYTERLKSLISWYAPPNPERMQNALQAGRANLNLSPGETVLTFTDYYKRGDRVSITFDPSTKKLLTYNVDTYLDDPEKDVVTLANQFASLPDGTNYLQETLLDAKGKQIQVKRTNSDFNSLKP